MNKSHQNIIWQPLFKRSGYPFFILRLAQEAYAYDMQDAVGWGYRDQLFLYDKGELQSFYSQRDSNSFKDFVSHLNDELIRKILASIIVYSDELQKKTKETISELDNVGSGQDIVPVLDSMYRAYRNLYSVYRFPTLLDQEAGENIDQILLHESAEAKDISGHAFNFADKNFLPKLAKKVSVYTDIPAKLVTQLSYQELKGLLLGHNKLNVRKLEERSNFLVLSMMEGEIALHVGEDGKKFLKKISLPNYKMEKVNVSTVITGKSAYKGTVIGRVCVLNNLESITELPQNSILVMPMTTVAVAPLLKNVIGIVTDEGGVTCHAAIISREKKIPCVTGTKVATKILNDGDVVEVNGDDGIVKRKI